VLYDNGWNHNESGRPHVVLSINSEGFLKLCPLTSHAPKSDANVGDPPIKARPGGLKFDSWVVAATRGNNQVRFAHHSEVSPYAVCRLNQGEYDAVLYTALAQIKRLPVAVPVA
jgi:hypothetical protein